MRILIFNWRDTNHPKAGGAEIVTLEHAKGWVRAGHRVTWFTAHFAAARADEVVDGVHIVRRGGSLTLFLLAPVYYLSHKSEYDIVIDEIHAVPFFTPLFVRKPKIAFIHEVAGDIWDYMVGFPLNRIGRFVEWVYFRLYRDLPFWTDAVSTVKHLGELGIPRQNCTAIECPISNEIYKENPVKEKNPTYLFVSRVVKMKGVEEVIKAFSFIVKENAASRLWIVGGGDSGYVQKLKEMLREYAITDQVVFLGKLTQEEKLSRMRRAHLLLHASVREGWGLVVLEAASQWTPSVVYNVSGLCDVVKNGKTGIVLAKNSPTEMAKEALQLLSDKKTYQRYQKEGLEWVSSLNWPDAVKKSESLLLNTIQRYAS